MASTRKAIVAAILGAPLVLIAIVIAVGASNDAPDRATPAAAKRLLLVSRDRMPAPSRAGSALHAFRLSGPVPRRDTSGTVLTDSQCAPDAQGISRCLNKIRLPDGQMLRVRHPHRMMDVACLSPGDRVTVHAA